MTETAQEKAAREHRERHQHNDITRGLKARPDNVAGCIRALWLGTASIPAGPDRDDQRELLLHTMSVLDKYRDRMRSISNLL